MLPRASSTKRGYGSRWQRYAEAFKKKHPLCRMCELLGKSVAAEVVDHIVAPRLQEALASGDEQAIAEARRLFWDPSNHQSLCKHCHDSHKQRFEKSGRVLGCDEDGFPIDPNHHWSKSC